VKSVVIDQRKGALLRLETQDSHRKKARRQGGALSDGKQCTLGAFAAGIRGT